MSDRAVVLCCNWCIPDLVQEGKIIATRYEIYGRKSQDRLCEVCTRIALARSRPITDLPALAMELASRCQQALPRSEKVAVTGPAEIECADILTRRAVIFFDRHPESGGMLTFWHSSPDSIKLY